ncbi:MAG: colanic acid biosynthesis glycosyltransferase WcaL [Candidatus Scalindua sp.]|nr:MAG: colanic acid biosynthesis glycosyltransferase WcaL [Candidatus Scalindua sp. SCAELEC01]GJQ57454.1 MAG: colanic acid biosynthesis glycosyltransferase WcaL [Candidatus Scalindua sp.]
MKIAYILNVFPCLYHTFILNDILNLMKNGHEVLVLSIGRSHEKVMNKGVFNLKNNIYYFDDFLIKNNLVGTRYFIEFAKKYRKYNPFYRFFGKCLFGNSVSGIDAERYSKNFGWGIYALKRIADKLKEENVDIIHGAFGANESTAAMILSELTEIPFSFETHAKDLFVYFEYASEKIEKAKKIFTISEYNKKYLINDLKCPASKIILKRVPFNRSHCDQIPEKQRKEDLILAVCRLNPIKGLEYAIEAFSLVAQKRDELRFKIVGDGPLKEELFRKVKKLQLTEKITFLGNMSNEDAMDLVAQSTIVVLPSVIIKNGDRDGIPTSLIEAMYLKTPVISSRISGIPELIDDGINGFLTEPGDVRQIAEKMEELLLDKVLRSRMGEGAREKIINNFDNNENSNKLIDAWREIV